MRIKMAASAAMVMMAVAACGGAAKEDAMKSVWASWGEMGQKASCEAAIQNGTNFYGPARALAAKAGNGVTQYDAQQFMLDVCPDAWLMGGVN